LSHPFCMVASFSWMFSMSPLKLYFILFLFSCLFLCVSGNILYRISKNDFTLNYWTWQKRGKKCNKLFHEKFDWFSAFVVVSIISLIWKKIFLPLDERSFLSFSPKNVIFSLTSIRHVVANLKFVSEGFLRYFKIYF
jgi:hypothetical protein